MKLKFFLGFLGIAVAVEKEHIGLEGVWKSAYRSH